MFSKKKNNVLLSEIIYNDPNAVEIFISSKAPHAGAAVSSWYAQWALEGNNLMESPLVIVNCDQILNLDYEDFFNFIKENDPDGAVILYKSSNPKNSFAKIEDGRIVEIIEKDPISEDALVGFHYWKRAKDFFQSTEKLYIKLQPTLHEAYTSETYNFLIKDGKTILPYFIDSDKYISLGTPEDIDSYMGSGEWRGQQDG
jgi:dTDP-glucose pyrophosphorylase